MPGLKKKKSSELSHTVTAFAPSPSSYLYSVWGTLHLITMTNKSFWIRDAPHATHRPPSLKTIVFTGNSAQGQGVPKGCSGCALHEGTRPRGLRWRLKSSPHSTQQALTLERASRRKGTTLMMNLPREGAPFAVFPPENVGHHLFLICIKSSFELELVSALTYNSRTAESPEAHQWTDRGHDGSSGQEL